MYLLGQHWVIRMPNFVKVDSKPFHPDTYMGPEHDEDEVQHGENLRERSMTIKLKVENTVRWKWGKDELGQDVRQSNSRVIRWSDGTLSLRLGKELFDINQSIDTSGAAPRGLFSGSQTQTPQSQSQSQPESSQPPTKSQGLTYLISQHKRAQILQSEATITGYMSLRPTGMQSETHRMLVRAVGQKHNKVARLRMAPDPTMDPEKEVADMAKNAAKKSKKKNNEEGYGYGGRKKRSGGGSRRRPTDWSDSEEEDEGLGPGYGDEDEEDEAGHRAKKADAKKGRGEYEEDDFVIADEDDEDGSEGGGARKRKRQPDLDDEEVEEDPLDKMEAKLEAQERKKKHRKPSEEDADAAGDDDAMEVESEEEEDPDDEVIKVRRTGTGARKKRAIDFEDEEEDE